MHGGRAGDVATVAEGHCLSAGRRHTPGRLL